MVSEKENDSTSILTLLPSSLFVADLRNREKIGIRRGGVPRKYIVNDFVSNIIFNPSEIEDEDAIRQCLERLGEVAFVDIRMTRHDVVVTTKVLENSLARIVADTGES